MSDHSVISEPTPSTKLAQDGARTAPPPSALSPSPAPASPRTAVETPNIVPQIRRFLIAVAAIAAAVGGYFAWQHNQPEKLPAGFASSNGRMEATEIDVATKLAGRLVSVLIDEGDFVTAGQVVDHIDRDSLNAQLREAEAHLRRAKTSIEAAEATVRQREKEKAAAEAVVKQREAELDAQMKHFECIKKLTPKGAATEDELDHSRSEFYGARGGLEGASAQVLAADAAIATAKAQVIEAQASVEIAQAKIERLESDLKDCTLNAPREGRVQYRVAQPGEVLYGGGKVLNMVDLNDVYMTFFLPTEWAGRVSLGSEVRLVLDGAPEFVIPAKVTFVADVAQFTPKTVETKEERQKLTFRVKAHIPEDLLKKHVRDVKTGVPGVQVDPDAEWPAKLQVKLYPKSNKAHRQNKARMMFAPGSNKDASREQAPVARLTNVRLTYGKTHALDDVTIDVPAGCMVGLIGPDGVGRPTRRSAAAVFGATTSIGMEQAATLTWGMSRTCWLFTCPAHRNRTTIFT